MNQELLVSSHKSHLKAQELIFCNVDNMQNSLSALSEELECFDIIPIFVNENDLNSLDSIKIVLSKVINASWKLMHKHRILLASHNQINDAQRKISNDNFHLKNQLKRLKEDLQKTQQNIDQLIEKERRVKVQCETLSRDFKHEKNEVLKLKKQLQSKDNQHEHELRRIAQNNQKLQDRMQKSTGPSGLKNKGFLAEQSEFREKVDFYEKIICQLEENNRSMLEEINELKEALSLHITNMELPGGIHHPMDPSGIWSSKQT